MSDFHERWLNGRLPAGAAHLWGTNLYEGEPVGDIATTIDCGRLTQIYNMHFREGVNLLAAPSIAVGEVYVANCMFAGRVRYTPNVKFDNCYLRAGKPEVWEDDLRVRSPEGGTP